MRILCTGDLGFIGSHVRKALTAAGHETFGADIKRGVLWDINKLQMISFDVIVHHAGQSSQAESIANPSGDVYHNVLGTLNLLQQAKQAGVKHFIFASTSCVYADEGTLTERTPFAPRNPYGVTKLAAEFFIKTSGIPYTIFRYANVYGEGQMQVGENQLIPHCLDHLLNGQPFAIHGDGTKARDWIYIDDVVAANLTAIDRQIQGVYNVGSETSVSVNQVCATLAGLCNRAGYEFKYDANRAGEAERTLLISAKFRNAAQWYGHANLTEGLARTVKWWETSRRRLVLHGDKQLV